MALDVFAAEQQLWRLSQQSSSLQAVRRKLERYRGELEQAWVGTEVKYYHRTLDSLGRQCDLLEERIEGLRTDISTAVDEIIAEEEAAAEEEARAAAAKTSE